MQGRDLTNMRFGRLVALDPTGRDSHGYIIWRCKCDCGNETFVSSRYLVGNGTTSCGCYAKEIARNRLTRHGKRFSRLYGVHKSMLQRCTNPNAHEYENYGGRGIKVADEWLDFCSFEKWAMANGYGEDSKRGECTLDRIDQNGNYEPSNCRFVTMKAQQRNRRNNRLITHNGETHCMSEWAEIAGLGYGTFCKRIYAGWPMEKALTPVNR